MFCRFFGKENHGFWVLLGPVDTNPIGSVVPEKAPIQARGEQFGGCK